MSFFFFQGCARQVENCDLPTSVVNQCKLLKVSSSWVQNRQCCRVWCWSLKWTEDFCLMRRTMLPCWGSAETALAVEPRDSDTSLSFQVILTWSLPRSPRNRNIWSTTLSGNLVEEYAKGLPYHGKVWILFLTDLVNLELSNAILANHAWPHEWFWFSLFCKLNIASWALLFQLFSLVLHYQCPGSWALLLLPAFLSTLILCFRVVSRLPHPPPPYSLQMLYM